MIFVGIDWAEAHHAEEAEDVVVGIETDRGLLVGALVAAGYRVSAINPLADLVRTDRQHHRVVSPDSELPGAIKVLARAHQNLIWTRQRQVNALRTALAVSGAPWADASRCRLAPVLTATPSDETVRAVTDGSVCRGYERLVRIDHGRCRSR